MATIPLNISPLTQRTAEDLRLLHDYAVYVREHVNQDFDNFLKTIESLQKSVAESDKDLQSKISTNSKSISSLKFRIDKLEESTSGLDALAEKVNGLDAAINGEDGLTSKVDANTLNINKIDLSINGIGGLEGRVNKLIEDVNGEGGLQEDMFVITNRVNLIDGPDGALDIIRIAISDLQERVGALEQKP